MWAPLSAVFPSRRQPQAQRSNDDEDLRPLSIYSLPPQLPAKDGHSHTLSSSWTANDNPFVYDEKNNTFRSPTNQPPPRLSNHLSSKPLLWLSILSPPILGIIIVLVTLLLISATSKSQVAASKREIMAGCNAAQKALVALKAVPDLMEEQSKKALVLSVEASVKLAGKTLMLAVTILEAVLTFLIDSYRSIYLCAFELVIFGALALVIGAVEEIQDAITTVLAGIRTLIQSQVSAANSVISAAVSAINFVTKIVNVSLDVPSFDIPALTSLENVTVSTVIEDKLRQLNASLPTLNDIRTKLDSFIDEPFDLVVSKINATTGNFTFTPSPTPVSNVTNLAASTTDMCSDLDLSFIDEISNELSKIFHWAVGLIVVAGLIAILILLYLEHRRYLSFIERIEIFHAEHDPQSPYTQDELIELAQFSQANIVSVWAWRGIGMTRRLSGDSKRRSKWFVSLITHPLALAPLLIGILGLIALQCQIAAVSALSDKASAMTNSSITEMSTSMTQTLNADLATRGALYAAGLNADLAKVQKVLDDDIFGEWVNTTTVVLNGTLVEFYDLVSTTVNDALGSTIIGPSVNTFLFCILGSKVEKLSEALTWIHENAQFTLPTVDPNIFAVSNSSMEGLVAPIASAAVGGGSDDPDDVGVVQRLIAAYISSLEKAMILNWIFIGLWGLVVVGGLITVFLSARLEKRDRQRAEGTYVESTSPSYLRWPFGRPTLPQLPWNSSSSRSSQPSSAPHYYSHEPPQQSVEKINSLQDAFPPRAPFQTPLPSPQPMQLPLPQPNSFFEMNGGTAKSSPFPWILRPNQQRSNDPTPPSPPPTQQQQRFLQQQSFLPSDVAQERSPLSSLSNWTKKLAGRASVLASHNPFHSTSPSDEDRFPNLNPCISTPTPPGTSTLDPSHLLPSLEPSTPNTTPFPLPSLRQRRCQPTRTLIRSTLSIRRIRSRIRRGTRSGMSNERTRRRRSAGGGARWSLRT
ncbi:hypothetical protein BDY24DRAFT_417439 [Mrakia frigida]|uniref:pheromone-regulated protein PRM1 n=1 Tax=Mrakia frigida TaxID=29902 RepID=UPI003FCC054C